MSSDSTHGGMSTSHSKRRVSTQFAQVTNLRTRCKRGRGRRERTREKNGGLGRGTGTWVGFLYDVTVCSVADPGGGGGWSG